MIAGPVFLNEINLLKRNLLVEKAIKRMIGINSAVHFTANFEPHQPDWRTIINPKNKVQMESFSPTKYIQVFEEKHGFIPNLSILDLLFNLGPESKTYLKQLNQSIKNG